MTIRTNDDHEKLNGHSLVFSKYLPIELAYALPSIFQMIGKDLNDDAQRAEAIVTVGEFLAKSDCTRCIGFKRDGNDYHRCKLDYCDNVRTFAEDKDGINGKPSIGIQFVDADDGYNDWIWIATDVIMKFKYGVTMSRVRILDYVEGAAKFFGKDISDEHLKFCKRYVRAKEDSEIDITNFAGGKSFISLNAVGQMSYFLVNEKAKDVCDSFINLSFPTFKKFATQNQVCLNPSNIVKAKRILVPLKRLVYSDSKYFFGLFKKHCVDVEVYGTEDVTQIITVNNDVFYVKETIQEIDERIFQMKMCGFDNSSASGNSTVDVSDKISEQTDSCEPPPSAKE